MVGVHVMVEVLVLVVVLMWSGDVTWNGQPYSNWITNGDFFIRGCHDGILALVVFASNVSIEDFSIKD